jgi:uncharacterized membrane protein YgaE (UPF0421/DUF939 family)
VGAWVSEVLYYAASPSPLSYKKTWNDNQEQIAQRTTYLYNCTHLHTSTCHHAKYTDKRAHKIEASTRAYPVLPSLLFYRAKRNAKQIPSLAPSVPPSFPLTLNLVSSRLVVVVVVP